MKRRRTRSRTMIPLDIGMIADAYYQTILGGLFQDEKKQLRNEQQDQHRRRQQSTMTTTSHNEYELQFMLDDTEMKDDKKQGIVNLERLKTSNGDLTDFIKDLAGQVACFLHADDLEMIFENYSVNNINDLLYELALISADLFDEAKLVQTLETMNETSLKLWGSIHGIKYNFSNEYFDHSYDVFNYTLLSLRYRQKSLGSEEHWILEGRSKAIHAMLLAAGIPKELHDIVGLREVFINRKIHEIPLTPSVLRYKLLTEVLSRRARQTVLDFYNTFANTKLSFVDISREDFKQHKEEHQIVEFIEHPHSESSRKFIEALGGLWIHSHHNDLSCYFPLIYYGVSKEINLEILTNNLLQMGLQKDKTKHNIILKTLKTLTDIQLQYLVRGITNITNRQDALDILYENFIGTDNWYFLNDIHNSWIVNKTNLLFEELDFKERKNQPVLCYGSFLNKFHWYDPSELQTCWESSGTFVKPEGKVLFPLESMYNLLEVMEKNKSEYDCLKDVIQFNILRLKHQGENDDKMYLAYQALPLKNKLDIQTFNEGLFLAGCYCRGYQDKGPYPLTSELATHSNDIVPEYRLEPCLRKLKKFIVECPPATRACLFSHWQWIQYRGEEIERKSQPPNVLMDAVLSSDFCIREASSWFIGTAIYLMRVFKQKTKMALVAEETISLAS